jgi:predicted 3-demethylubiquinone-9 3-methyltransferase (glyoxalase superfamily)
LQIGKQTSHTPYETGLEQSKGENAMQKIIPFLWFDNQAEEAIQLYTSIFPNAKIGDVVRYGTEGPGPAGTVMTVSFTLNGQEFMALNGGPQFQFTEAVSFMIGCETQAEIDHFWTKLSAGGEEQPCGWLKDKFGLSWQVVPTALDRLLTGGSPAQSQRVMHALFQMKKIDLQTLQDAYHQGE